MNCGRFPTTENTFIGATLRSRLGPLAQLVEQGTLNPKVAGSIPARPISRGRLGGRPRELWFLGLVRRAWAGRWAVVHVCPAAGRPVPRTCPRLPEQQREQDAHETHAHQD